MSCYGFSFSIYKVCIPLLCCFFFQYLASLSYKDAGEHIGTLIVVLLTRCRQSVCQIENAQQFPMGQYEWVSDIQSLFSVTYVLHSRMREVATLSYNYIRCPRKISFSAYKSLPGVPSRLFWPLTWEAGSLVSRRQVFLQLFRGIVESHQCFFSSSCGLVAALECISFVLAWRENLPPVQLTAIKISLIHF